MDGGYVVDNLTITEIDTFLKFLLIILHSFENDLLKKNPYIEIIIYEINLKIFKNKIKYLWKR